MKTYQDFIKWLESVDTDIDIEYLSRPTRGVNKGKTSFTISKSFNNGLNEIVVQKNVLNPRELPLKVFELVITLLTNNPLDYSAHKGKTVKQENKKTLGIRLGDLGLELNTIEGFVAHECYDKQIGACIYRRAPIISNILVAASICTHTYGEGIFKLAK